MGRQPMNDRSPRKEGLPLVALLACVLLAFSLSITPRTTSAGVREEQLDVEQAESAPAGDPAADAEAEEEMTVDSVHEMLSKSVSASAAWMDAFFDDRTYEEEVNQSTLRLSLSTLWEEGEDLDVEAKVKLRVSLPRWENRLQLVIAGDSDDSNAFDDLEDEDLELPGDGDKNATVGLRYFAKQTKRHNVSLSGGLRWRDGAPRVYIQPRYRFFTDLGTWDARFIQKVGWFQSDGWESRSTLQFERILGDDYFFRTEGKLDWYEDEEGWFPQLNFILRKPLSRRRMASLEWRNYFETKPDSILESSVIKLRYRQRVYRDWLWFEVAPQVTFPEEDDYDWQPGLMLKLEAYFGMRHLDPNAAAGD